MKKRFWGKGDFWVILAVLLFCGTVFLLFRNGTAAQTAVVEYNGEIIDSLTLAGEEKEYAYVLPEGKVTLLAGARGVRMLSSDCPDKDCVRHGWARRCPDALICLPLRFSVTLQGAAEVDGYTGGRGR